MSSFGSGTPLGWYPDPWGRHELRFWDGATWSAQVADAGLVRVDDPAGPPAWGPTQAVTQPAAPLGPAPGHVPPPSSKPKSTWKIALLIIASLWVIGALMGDTSGTLVNGCHRVQIGTGRVWVSGDGQRVFDRATQCY